MVLQDDIDGKEYKVAMTMILVIVRVTVTVFMMTWTMTMTVLTGWAMSMTVLIYDNNHLGQEARLIMMMAMSTEMMILMWLMMKAM